ncbi:MAG: DNA polymerase-3 subunit epsilon [Alphaproteobacteria bacterium]|jgi:DNA polymerase-3 subunit epsilon
MRQIVLDTETTGLNPKDGHRIIEIGCIELINRKLTGNTFHVYINPLREIEQEAINVHGITNEFLADKPLFKNIVHDFIAFIKGAELIIHNAPFDVGFMDSEFGLTDRTLPKTESFCTILDTLVMARRLRPGQKNNLDALCKFYQVDNSRRTYHGALLDSEILAEVYLYMTGGQTNLSLNANNEDSNSDGIENVKKLNQKPALKIIHATADDIARDKAIFG